MTEQEQQTQLVRIAEMHDVVVYTLMPGGIVAWKCIACGDFWIPDARFSRN